MYRNLSKIHPCASDSLKRGGGGGGLLSRVGLFSRDYSIYGTLAIHVYGSAGKKITLFDHISFFSASNKVLHLHKTISHI